MDELESSVAALVGRVRSLQKDAVVERRRSHSCAMAGFVGLWAFVVGMFLPLTQLELGPSGATAVLLRSAVAAFAILLLTAVGIVPLVASLWRHLRPDVPDGELGLFAFLFAHGARLASFGLIVAAPTLHVASLVEIAPDARLGVAIAGWSVFFWAAATALEIRPQAAARRYLERSGLAPRDWPLEFQD